MSNSYKKTPIHGNTKSCSEKQDKRKANRKLRRVNKIAINEDLEPKKLREVSDIWSFNKDGKWYDNNNNKRLRRK